MTGHLRLRQICLVAARLEPLTGDLTHIFDVEVCHRDTGVAKYGLENVLIPFGTSFIEIVAPTRKDTAVGRFLERSGGHGGYMVILDCDDPKARQRHAESIGVRTAHATDEAHYLGIQLHPRDCRGAMIELNRTPGGEDLNGAYWPAGPDWQKAVRTTSTLGLTAAEIEAPDPDELSRHWGRILQRPAGDDEKTERRIALDYGSIDFIANSNERECLGGLRIAVRNPAETLDRAADRGASVRDESFHMGGVWWRLDPSGA